MVGRTCSRDSPLDAGRFPHRGSRPSSSPTKEGRRWRSRSARRRWRRWSWRSAAPALRAPRPRPPARASASSTTTASARPACRPAATRSPRRASSGLSCAAASQLFTRFLEDYDGVLPAPLARDRAGQRQGLLRPRQRRRLLGRPHRRRRRRRQQPSARHALPRHLHRQPRHHRRPAASSPRASYLLYIPPRSVISCRRASVLFTRFLGQPGGRLPFPWRVDQPDRDLLQAGPPAALGLPHRAAERRRPGLARPPSRPGAVAFVPHGRRSASGPCTLRSLTLAITPQPRPARRLDPDPGPGLRGAARRDRPRPAGARAAALGEHAGGRNGGQPHADPRGPQPAARGPAGRDGAAARQLRRPRRPGGDRRRPVHPRVARVRGGPAQRRRSPARPTSPNWRRTCTSRSGPPRQADLDAFYLLDDAFHRRPLRPQRPPHGLDGERAGEGAPQPGPPAQPRRCRTTWTR